MLFKEFQKLLDSGATVVVYQNELGSYTAVALSALKHRTECHDIIARIPDDSKQITDEFSPQLALITLAEKMKETK